MATFDTPLKKGIVIIPMVLQIDNTIVLQETARFRNGMSQFLPYSSWAARKETD